MIAEFTTPRTHRGHLTILRLLSLTTTLMQDFLIATHTAAQ